MPRINRCKEWGDLDLPCPYSLLDEVEKRKRKKPEVEEPPVFDELEARKSVPVETGAKKEREVAMDRTAVADREHSEDLFIGERNKRQLGQGQIVTMEQWEALLLEIARRSASQQIDMPDMVPVPQEIREEAIRFGARGIELSLWIATVAAVLAVAAAGGGKMALQVPATLKLITDARGRSVRPGGTLFNSAAELEFALGQLDRDLLGASGAGEFFPGILG